MRTLSSGLSILVVEDNAVNQKITAKLLELIGQTCDIAENGYRCLEMARTKYYDLIFLDVEMPGINGFETLRQLREFEMLLQLDPSYVIACTAFSLSGHREKCLEAGMDNYVTKPLKREVLKELIEQYLLARA